MDENPVARSRPLPSSDGDNQDCLPRQSEPDAGADDCLRSILAAAIGLTSLGLGNWPDEPRTRRSPPEECSPQKKGCIAPPKTKSVAAAAAAVGPWQTEPSMATEEGAKATKQNAYKRKKPIMASTPAAAPSQPSHSQKDLRCGRSSGFEMHPPDHSTTANRPTPYPHLFPQYPHPPPEKPSDEPSQLRSSSIIRAENKTLDVPLMCQRFTRRSRTMPVEQPQASPANNGDDATTSGTATPGNPPAANSISLNFPEILYEIISDPSNYHIISWLPNGQGFVIHNRQLFSSELLPRYFDGAKYTSFTRRLKRWKFERVPRGPEMGAYYNKCFVKDRPDLVSSMVYGMEDGEGSNENQGDQDGKKKKKKKKGGKNKQAEAAQGSGVHDDVVVEAVMGVRRQAREQLQRDMEVQQQQRQLKRDMDGETVIRDDDARGGQTENKVEENTQGTSLDANLMAKATAEIRRQVAARVAQVERQKRSEAGTGLNSHYDDAMVEPAMEVHRQQKLKLQQRQLSKEPESSSQQKNLDAQRPGQEQALSPSRKGLEKNHPPSGQGGPSPEILPMPYDSSDHNFTGSGMPTSRQGNSSSEKLRMSCIPSNVGDYKLPMALQQKQQSSLLRMQQQSSKDSAAKPNQSQYQNLPNSTSQTYQLGYEDPTKLQRKRKHQEQGMQPQPQQPFFPLKFDSWSHPVDLQRHNLPTQHNPEAVKSEDYLVMSMARRNLLAPLSLADSRAMTHHSNGIPDALSSIDRNGFLLRTIARRRNNNPDTTAFLEGNVLLSNHVKSASSPEIEEQKYLNDSERRARALSEMTHPMLHTAPSPDPLLPSSYLRSKMGENIHGPRSTNSYLRSNSIEDDWMKGHIDRANKAMADQENMLGRTSREMRNNRLLLANQEMTKKILVSSKRHKEIMMMAARDLQARARAVRFSEASPQQQHHMRQPHLQGDLIIQEQEQTLLPPLRPLIQGPPRMQLQPSNTNNFLSSHAISLLELQEKVERETMAARTEAAAAGLTEEGELGQAPKAKRRNSRASAA